MSKSAFERLLNLQNVKPQTEHEQFQARIDEWLLCFEQFYKSLELWLAPYIVKGLVTYAYKEHPLNDFDIDYTAKMMVVSFAEHQLTFEPNGTDLASRSTRGSVSMVHLNSRIAFILTTQNIEFDNQHYFVEGEQANWVWQIWTQKSAAPAELVRAEFNEENFFHALMDILNS